LSCFANYTTCPALLAPRHTHSRVTHFPTRGAESLSRPTTATFLRSPCPGRKRTELEDNVLLRTRPWRRSWDEYRIAQLWTHWRVSAFSGFPAFRPVAVARRERCSLSPADMILASRRRRTTLYPDRHSIYVKQRNQHGHKTTAISPLKYSLKIHKLLS